MPETSPSHRDVRTEPSDSRSDIGGRRRRFDRYDLLLATIPAAFLVGFLVSQAAGVPVREAMAVAAMLGVLALVDGLFINPPRRPRVDGGSP